MVGGLGIVKDTLGCSMKCCALPIRHRRLMHNIVNYDAHVIREFVQLSVMPWRNNFRSLLFIAEQHHLSKKNPKTLPSSTSNLSQEKILSFIHFYNQIGLAYTRLHQWKQAEKYLLLAYEFTSSVEDNEQLGDSIACIMHNLCDVYRNKGDWETTTKWMRLTWEHRQANLPEMHPYYVSTLIHLGICFEHLHDRVAALKCYLDGLEICRKHGLDQTHALIHIADFYAEQMDYSNALTYYKLLLPICQDKRHRIYLLKSLQTYSVECGQHEEALNYYNEMKNLFHHHLAYFKAELDSGYLEFEQAMVGPIYILDLMGKDEEALSLLNKVLQPCLNHQLMRLRLLRNLGLYDEALRLGESFRTEGKQNLISEVIYAEVLIHSGRVEEGISILEKICNQLTACRNNRVLSQAVLSPFNVLCQYFLRVKQFEMAKACIQAAMPFLDKIKFSGLSYEILTTLNNFYMAHLLIGDIKTVREQITKDEPFIVESLKRTHSKNAYAMFAQLIGVLIDHQCFEIANRFLTALISTENVLNKAQLHSLMMLYLHLADSLIEVNKVDKGISKLIEFLSKYCPEEDKCLVSFILAERLMKFEKFDLLCQIVTDYQQYWNESLALDTMPIYEVFRRISNLSFCCANFKADNGMFDEATIYAQTCISLARKIYSLLNEVKPKGQKQFEEELFRQYWRMPMAIVEFQNYDSDVYERIQKLFYSILKINSNYFSIPNAEKINVVFFGGELALLEMSDDPSRALINIPPRWKNFLTAFNEYIPIIIRSRKSTPLKPLRMSLETTDIKFKIDNQRNEDPITGSISQEKQQKRQDISSHKVKEIQEDLHKTHHLNTHFTLHKSTNRKPPKERKYEHETTADFISVNDSVKFKPLTYNSQNESSFKSRLNTFTEEAKSIIETYQSDFMMKSSDKNNITIELIFPSDCFLYITPLQETLKELQEYLEYALGSGVEYKIDHNSLKITTVSPEKTDAVEHFLKAANCWFENDLHAKMLIESLLTADLAENKSTRVPSMFAAHAPSKVCPFKLPVDSHAVGSALYNFFVDQGIVININKTLEDNEFTITFPGDESGDAFRNLSTSLYNVFGESGCVSGDGAPWKVLEGMECVNIKINKVADFLEAMRRSESSMRLN